MLEETMSILKKSMPPATRFKFKYIKKEPSIERLAFQIGPQFICGKERMACGHLREVTG